MIKITYSGPKIIGATLFPGQSVLTVLPSIVMALVSAKNTSARNASFCLIVFHFLLAYH
jgi:hypothetical protein